MAGPRPQALVPGLGRAIRAFSMTTAAKAWMAGTRPAMTRRRAREKLCGLSAPKPSHELPLAPVQQPPGQLGCDGGQPAARLDADHLQHHSHAALDMAEAIELHRPAEIRRGAVCAAEFMRFRLVSAVPGEGEFVVLALKDAAQRDTEPA